jgi:predicted transcriptional regulator YheO
VRPEKKQQSARDAHADMVFDLMRPVVHMIAGALGRNSEVVLHDFRNPSASVIEIAGTLSKREVGAPVNDINRWLLSHGRDVRVKTEKFVRTKRGRTMRTSTVLFRDDTGKAFGALCFNIDVTEMLSAARMIAEIAGSDELAPATPKLVDDIAYVVKAVVAAEEARLGRRLNITNRSDRLHVMRALRDQGVFTLKRAVPRLAEHFEISRATVYSYLSELKATDGAET